MFAHGKEYVHRDLKPANLLFSSGGDLKIADFGLAIALSAAAHTEPIGVLMGTAKYASPEQARGVSVGAPSDIYSLGLIMYEAIASRLPFEGDTTVSVLLARIDKDVPAPDEAGGLGELIERCLRGLPEERITALELVRGLDRLARSLDPPEVIAALHAPHGPYGFHANVQDDHGDHTLVLEPFDAGQRGGIDRTVDAAASLRGRPSSFYDLEDDPGDATAVVVDSSVQAVRSGSDLTAGSYVDVALADADVGGGDRGSNETQGSSRRKRALVIWIVVTLLASLIAFGGAYLYSSLTKTTVPSLEGLSIAHSQTIAKRSDLKVLVTSHRYSLSTPQGDIIGTFPHPGVVVAKKSIVDVTVSLGPAPVKVPLLTGETQAEISSQLSALHFKATFSQTYSETVPSGEFVFSQPPAGSTEQYGSTVAIVLSKGPVPRKVPNLVGESQSTATATLSSEQLGISVTAEYSNTVAKNDVISQVTTPGAYVPRGTAIAVAVSLGPHYVVVPNVIGDTQAAATAALQSVGLTVGRVYVTLGNSNVLLTAPAYGTQVLYGSSVSLIVD
jgi:serine/threonine-protein kinase